MGVAVGAELNPDGPRECFMALQIAFKEAMNKLFWRPTPAGCNGISAAASANLFLLDERRSNLDVRFQVSVRLELKRLRREIRGTVPYSTHDQVEVDTSEIRLSGCGKDEHTKWIHPREYTIDHQVSLPRRLSVRAK
jgi:hypothetical protein